MSSRGFTIEELSKHGIGYVATEGPFFGYLIIPYYYKGMLRYYNARNVIGQGPRYNNPNKDITGLGKEFIIFNQDALDMYSSIFICEGAINALTMGEGILMEDLLNGEDGNFSFQRNPMKNTKNYFHSGPR